MLHSFKTQRVSPDGQRMDSERWNYKKSTTLTISEGGDPTFSRSRLALLCCQKARQLERAANMKPLAKPWVILGPTHGRSVALNDLDPPARPNYCSGQEH